MLVETLSLYDRCELANGRANIVGYLNAATPEQHDTGLYWYHDAWLSCRGIALAVGMDYSDDSLATIAHVVAALSPRNKWQRNLEDASNLIDAYCSGRQCEDVTVCTFNANREKAWRILQGDTAALRGRKVESFVDNIVHYGTSQRVTIDVWALRAYLGMPSFSVTQAITDKTYDMVEAAYQDVAYHYGMLPHQVQAIVWSVIRGTGT